ncbi:MAG: UTP--glucose-1-phosphate uridylyltransferase [Desulfobacterales bacterium]|jgi:UTP--glucose-1-phosphate uridylyltransferase
MKHSEVKDYLPDFISKMEAEGLPSIARDTFAHYYKQLLTGETGLIFDRDIRPVAAEEIEALDNLSAYTEVGKKAYQHAIRIVLNGGLGTSMGLVGPKSLLDVKFGHSFLSLIMQQTQSNAVQLAFMNSFSTHDDTIAALKKLNPARFPLTFIQHKFPKIILADYTPATWPRNPKLEWNPPGHGDVYTALYASGLLDDLLKKNIEFALITNSDNLGARMNASLLGFFCEHAFPFMMEVAEKTPSDIKGGHLARHSNGRLILRESAQCPEDELATFQDIDLYKYFNTNNVWVNLKALKRLFEEEKAIHLPLIVNPKTLDPRDKSSPSVLQIETAMGAAISLFEGATAVRVPRSRFFPVKTCNDLLAARSDYLVCTADNNLQINPQRQAIQKADTIKIQLDPRFYGKIDDLDERFRQGVPSLVECESLSVEGDVRFQKNVIIKGAVSIKNSSTTQAVIKAGTVIDTDLIL